MGNTRYSIENINSSAFDKARLLYASTSKYEGDWQSILHSHPFSELFYVVNGSGSFVAEGMEFPVTKNDLVIINPHVQHTEKSLNTSPLDYIVLGIDGLSFSFQESAEDIFPVSQSTDAVHKYSAQGSKVYAYLNIILEEISKKEENYETVCQNLLKVMLTCMLRNENLTIIQNDNIILNRECSQIKDYIDTHYSENITLDYLAKLTHMNKFYMAHAFTKHTGLSPINYLLQKRIQEGKNLLTSTNFSIAEISAALGFSSQSYFSQAFKKAVGKSPNQFRHEVRKED